MTVFYGKLGVIQIYFDWELYIDPAKLVGNCSSKRMDCKNLFIRL
jgi:uncharacterized protein (DUF1919 family)